MNRLLGFSALLVFGCVWQLSAQIDIGSLELTGSNYGYQTVDLYNFTGATDGCGMLGPYNVCNALDINTWSLEIDYIPNVAGIGNGIGVASSAFFTSSGPADLVPPTDASFDAYTGDSNNTWSLPMELTNGGCSPACDLQVTQVILTGTVDQTALQLYNNGGPTIAANVPGTFTATLTVPQGDYIAGDNNIFESTDIFLDTQVVTPPTTTTTPEPASLGLILVGAAGLAFQLRRSTDRL